MSAARVSPRLLAVLLTVAASSWTAAIFFAPLAHAATPIAASAVNVTASFVCHQRDERSFHLRGERLAVCGRCTGLYLAGTIGALAAWLGVARVPARTRRLLVFAAVPTAMTLAIEWTGAANPGNAVRATAALPLGAVAGWLFVRLLRLEEQPGTCAIITESMAIKSTTAERARPATEPGTLVLLCLAAWAIPGAGHFWLGRAQKGVVFLAALTMLFVMGLVLQGRLFPFDLGEPLVALAAFANAGLGLPWVVGRMLGLGGGVVTAATYEYGNSFLIVSGLLNFLVILDAFDIAVGRK